MPTIQNRRATAAQWTAANPVLAAGELGFELDTNSAKIGDGLTPWETLPYLSDESLSELVETGRLSEAVLSATYAPLDGIRDTFTGRPDGPLTTTLTGQDYVTFGTPVGTSGVLPAIVDGKFVQPYTGPGATYLQSVNSRDVTRLGARWTFTAGSTNSGAAALIAWDANYADTYPATPDAACHLVFTKTSWTYGVFSDGVLSDITGSLFAVPLADDGVTIHTAEVAIDRAKGKASITLPDGSLVTVTDPRIGTLGGNVAVWESITSATTDPRAQFLDVWSSTDPTPTHASTPRPALQAVKYAPATAEYVVVPTSWANVKTGAMELTVVAPPSGRVLVTLSAYLIVTVETLMLWGLSDPVVGLLSPQVVLNAPMKGQVTLPIVLDDLIPGYAYTFRWQHLSTVDSAATWAANGPGGYVGSMTAQTL